MAAKNRARFTWGLSVFKNLVPFWSRADKQEFFPVAAEITDSRQYTINAGTFQAITIPAAGAKFVLIEVGQAVSLTLKGVTGDAGIPIAPVANPLGVPVCLPLGAVTALGILNGAGTAQTIQVHFI